MTLAWFGTGCGGGAEGDWDALDSGIIVSPGGGTQGGGASPTGGGAAGGVAGTSLGGGGTPGSGGIPGSGGTIGTSSPGTAGGTGSGGTAGGTLDAGTQGGGGSDAGSKTDAATTTDSGTSGGDAGTTTPDAGGGTAGAGDCCPDGNCLCHGTPPAKLSAAKGPFKVATLQLATGVAHYPTDAKPPFAGVAICPGFLNFGPEVAEWGAFYASWGIVTLVTDTIPTDVPEIRAEKLLASVKALKAENTKAGSPLNGKMSDRYGTSGYSMGGGGTTHATVTDPSLKTSIGLAPWAPVGRNVKVPTLLMCGDADTVAPCSHTDDSYGTIPNTTPKMKMVIRGASHLTSWFGPADGGGGTSGGWALAFQKYYLEGDVRWKDLLLAKPSNAQVTTNITP